MMDGLASEAANPKAVMIDATYLKATSHGDQPAVEKEGQAPRGGI